MSTHEAAGREARVHLELSSGLRFSVAFPDLPDSTLSGDVSARLARCEGLFEDFWIVTESVRHGIPVNVRHRVAPSHLATVSSQSE